MQKSFQGNIFIVIILVDKVIDYMKRFVIGKNIATLQNTPLIFA